MKITQVTETQNLAPACFAAISAASHAQMSAWGTPVQGIAMSAPALRLGSVDGMTATVIGNATKGANRKRTAGYPAFEDPL